MSDQADATAHEVRMIAANCRLYEKEYPDVGEVVMVAIDHVEKIGATVSLLEYGGVQGMVIASEVSRRRLRSLKAAFANIKTMACCVLRVDTTKGYIDLSKKSVGVEETRLAEQRYANARQVHSILARVAHMTNNKLIDLYKLFGWDLYKRYTDAHEAFTLLAVGQLQVLAPYDIPKDVYDALINIIKLKMPPRPLTIFARLEATCFGPLGVVGLQQSFQKGIDLSTETQKIRIRVVGPPQYVIHTITDNKTSGLKLIQSAIDAVTVQLEQHGGRLLVPRGIQCTNQDLDLDNLQDDEEKDTRDNDDNDDGDDEDDEDEDYDEDDE